MSVTLPIADKSEDELERPARTAVSAPYAAGALYTRTQANSEKSITIILADRHDVVRQGVRNLLEAELTFAVVGKLLTGKVARDLVDRWHPTVLITDFPLLGRMGETSFSTSPKISHKRGCWCCRPRRTKRMLRKR